MTEKMHTEESLQDNYKTTNVESIRPDEQNQISTIESSCKKSSDKKRRIKITNNSRNCRVETEKSEYNSEKNKNPYGRFDNSMKRSAAANHDLFKRFGLKSLQLLQKEIENKRYPGFSEFFSSNALQNSSPIYKIPLANRFSSKEDKKMCDNIYNLPMNKSTRAASIGFGGRRNPLPQFGKDSPLPGTYNIKSFFDINLGKGKGASLRQRFSYGKDEKLREPGVGAYNISTKPHGLIPIEMTFRHCIFYDTDLKQKKFTVSPEKYSPLHTLTEQRRFNGVGFGIGSRPPLNPINGYPGPNHYKIPGICERGLKGKLPLN